MAGTTYKATKWAGRVRVATTGLGLLEGTGRGIQGVKLLIDSNGQQGYGYIGEAFLRLLGVAADVRAAKLARRAENGSLIERQGRLTLDDGATLNAPKETKIGKFLQGDDVAEAGKHTSDVGEVTGVVDRAGAAARRRARLKGKQRVTGKDLDEYPPAVIKPDDPSKVSVRPIDRTHNRRSGGRLRHEVPPDETKVRIEPPDGS